jgi:hypothetical protein
MSERTVNLDVPQDCISILQLYLEKGTKNGLYTLDDTFMINLALRTMKAFVKTHSLSDTAFVKTHSLSDTAFVKTHSLSDIPESNKNESGSI